MVSTLKSKLVSLLRQGEKITKTDNVYLAKSFSPLWSFQTFTMVNGLILYYLFARFVPSHIYGEYKYYIALFELFALTTLTGTKISLAPAISRGFHGTLSDLFKKRLRYSLIGSFGGLILTGFLLFKNQINVAIALGLISILGPLIHSSGLTSSYMIGIKNFSLYAKANFFLEFTAFILITLTIFIRPNPLILFAVYLFAGSLNFFFYIKLAQNTANNKIDPNAFSTGKYYSLLDGFNIFSAKIDGLILFHLLGPSSLAIYSFALIPVDQIRGYLNHIQSIALPKISVGNYAILRKSLTARMPLFMLLILLVVLAYTFTATYIYSIFFPTYQESVLYSQIYAFSLIFAIPAIVYQALFQSHEKKQIAGTINTINNFLQIICMIIGIYFYGILGLVIARTLVSMTTFFISLLYSNLAASEATDKKAC